MDGQGAGRGVEQVLDGHVFVNEDIGVDGHTGGVFVGFDALGPVVGVRPKGIDGAGESGFLLGMGNSRAEEEKRNRKDAGEGDKSVFFHIKFKNWFVLRPQN